MKELVRGAILNILNNQLGSWIMQQGGWVSFMFLDWLIILQFQNLL